MKKLAIIGSALSGGAAQVIDAAISSCTHRPVAIFDSKPNAIGLSVLGVPVVGSSGDIKSFWKKKEFDEIVIAIGGDLLERQKVYETLRTLGVPFANVIDKTAQIRMGAEIGLGNVILANVFIGPSVKIGNNCYLITNTSINHDTRVGSHVYFGPGCTVAGHVTIGDRVRLDINSGVKAKLKVENDSYIPPGKILTKNI